jgi:acyl-CoA thioester hydrolase
MPGFRCVVPIEVQFRDLDALRHVNNAVYFSYLENGRIAYLSTILGRPLGVDDVRLVLVDAACRYHSPALLGDPLAMGVRVTHMRRTSFAFAYRLVCVTDGRLVAEARTIQTAYDPQSARIIPIDPQLRAAVERLEARSFEPTEVIPPWGRQERRVR